MSSKFLLNHTILFSAIIALCVSLLGCDAIKEAQQRKEKKEQQDALMDSLDPNWKTRNTPQWLRDSNQQERERMAVDQPPIFRQTGGQTEYGLAYALILGVLVLGLVVVCVPRPRKKELIDPNANKKQRKHGSAF